MAKAGFVLLQPSKSPTRFTADAEEFVYRNVTSMLSCPLDVLHNAASATGTIMNLVLFTLFLSFQDDPGHRRNRHNE